MFVVIYFCGVVGGCFTVSVSVWFSVCVFVYVCGAAAFVYV